MGNVLIVAGLAGLALSALGGAAAFVILRRQGRRLSGDIEREYEE